MVLSLEGSNFSTKKVYEHIIRAPDDPTPFKWIWKTPCLPKHSFFFWLLLQDKLNTRDLLQRKNFHLEEYTCVLCEENIRETVDHLFFEREFSRNFWWSIGEEWNMDLGIIDRII